MSLDYTDFKEKKSESEQGQKDKQSAALGTKYWWQFESGRDIGNEVCRVARHIETQQSYRTEANLRHARIYGNFDLIGFGGRDYGRSMTGIGNQLALNLIASCIDTITSKITKNKPRPTYQTFGGEWKLQRKAKKLDHFTQGAFYEARLYQKAPMVFRDAGIFGTGALKVFIDDAQRIGCERVFPDDLLVDDADGIAGEPRQLFQRMIVARELLLSKYDDEEAQRAIINARAPTSTFDVQRSASAKVSGDMVRVFEAWHLPSSEGADDGRHIIAIDGLALLDEKWESARFPFAVQRYIPRVQGFYGQGLAERLWGIQLEINRTVRRIAEVLRMCSVPRTLVPREAQIAKGHLRGGDDALGDIITYSAGAKPEMWVPSAVAPEHFQQLDRLWQKGYDQEGISQLSAVSQKPAGLNSQPSLREYDDIKTERFAPIGMAYEQFFLDAAEIMIELARKVSEEKGDYEVKAPLRNALAPVKWSDIDLARDVYTMQCFPISSLPTTPEGRLQTLQEMANAGLIDSSEVRRLMNLPDLEQSDSLATASLDDIDAGIEAILDGDTYEPPDPMHPDLPLLISRATGCYFRAKRNGAPADTLSSLLGYIDQAQGIIEMRAQKAAAQQQAAALGPPGAGPGGGPGGGIPVAASSPIPPLLAPGAAAQTQTPNQAAPPSIQ